MEILLYTEMGTLLRSNRIFKAALAASILIGACCYLYIVAPDKEDRKAWENIEKIRLVKLGMDTTRVIEIMGQPLEKRVEGGELYFDYEVPSGWSLQCQIIFDSRGNVVYLSPLDHFNE
ncbi:hypothetical protein [Mariniradius saccharolyticus]|uniref:hypothetical protein n=1 Tax=Mariniradius saccharolyticus TaxID=1245591 RepID=UPI0014615BAB|nr:hypothetical protein [Mariniradius saccharolyticus]